MKYVYASRTGNTEKLVKDLGLDALKIEDGSETEANDYVLFTYTDGNGIVPETVETFLKNNHANLKGVVVLGNSTRHPNTFAAAGDLISKEYTVPVLAKVDTPLTDETVNEVKAALL